MKPLHSNDRFVRVPSLMTLASKDGKQPRLCGNSHRIRESEHRWFSKADSWSLTVIGFFPSRGGVGSALMDLPRSIGGAMGGYAPTSRIARMVSWNPKMLITRLRL